MLGYLTCHLKCGERYNNIVLCVPSLLTSVYILSLIIGDYMHVIPNILAERTLIKLQQYAHIIYMRKVM